VGRPGRGVGHPPAC